MRRILWAAPLAVTLFACGVAEVGDVSTDDGAQESAIVTNNNADGTGPLLCQPSECGPAPRMATLICHDGSTGGFTGRCIKRSTGCAWEVRPCPPPPCMNPAGCPPPAQCGPKTCAAGEVCCNASCGLCVKPGQSCVQIACPCSASNCPPTPRPCTATECGPQPGAPTCQCPDGSLGCNTGKCERDPVTGTCGWEYRVCPAPPPVKCGSKLCPQGQVCCNASCGICVPPGGACTTQACPPPATCTPADCGPAPMGPACLCPDGSTGCNTGVCRPDPATGKCGWEFRVCPAPPPVKCGSKLCPQGEVCCNASCGICTPPGGACTAQVCQPPPVVQCGPKTCAQGEVCCNASCGICTPPGGACTTQVCPPTPSTCTATECGPAPESPTCLCKDGSTGCNTGVCKRDSTGRCGWEYRVCPP